MSAALKLEVFHNGELIQEVACEGKEIWVGRDEDCVIRLEDRAISRKHALLRPAATGVEFEKKSKFGSVRIGGRNVEHATLKGGEQLEFGDFEIRVHKIEAEKPAPDAVPETLSVMVTEPVVEQASAALPEESGMEAAPFETPAEPALDENAGIAEPGGMDFVQGLDQDSGQDEFAQPEAGGNDSAQDEFAEPDLSSQDPDGATRLLKGLNHQMKPVLDFPDSGNFYELSEEEGTRIYIGRANCHVILEDKKASRKHVSIETSGKKHVLKDLGSSNGTLVNGERIDERELVSGDEIQIGDTKFVYKLVQKDFEDKKQSFLQVPEEPMPDPVAPLMPVETLAPPPAQAFESFASQSMGGVEPAMPPSEDFAAPAEDKRGMIAKALDYYRALPVKMQVIYGGVILFGIYFFMEDDTPPPKAKMEIVQQQKKDVKKDPGQKAPTAPTFELLPPETQKYIESQYKIAFEHYRNHEYDSCLLELGKIFTYVQDYKSAREIESYAKLAKQQIEAAEEERKRKEVERQAQIRLQSLIDQAGLLMDQKKYKEAEAVFPDIELIQPENSQVANWKKKITEEAERAEADRIQREKIAKLRADQWGELHAAEKVLEEKNYFEALDLFDAFLERDSLEPEMVKAANAGIKKAEDSIAAERDPLLAEGKRLEAEGKENDAYRTYQKVLKVDPTDTEAPAGMARIRGALNARAKSIYSEGVIAEGFGDLAGAEKKYLEVLEAVPADNDYYLKAKGRIKRLTAYRGNGGEGPKP